MAVANSITKKPTATQQNAITFTSGTEEIKLTPAMVKAYLVSGDSSNVTDQEITMFMMMCKSNHLNPWNREAYCIKYGTSPATMVVGKDAFLKRAERHPQYDGMTSGIIVLNDGGIEYRQGILKFKDEELLGGWAEVFRKDRTHSSRIEVSFEEYAGRKKDGTLNNQWATKPATMIRKVAQVQALKEAFPDDLGGMYTAEEQNVEEAAPTNVPLIDMADAQVEKKPAPKKAEPAPVDDDADSLL